MDKKEDFSFICNLSPQLLGGWVVCDLGHRKQERPGVRGGLQATCRSYLHFTLSNCRSFQRPARMLVQCYDSEESRTCPSEWEEFDLREWE